VTPPGTRRERAVARSVDPARVRAEKRLQRFLDAACELIAERSGADFTVQEVVERSGQSLRSFYQYFAGKHELVLALFEEAVRSAAENLRVLVAQEPDPLARLRRLVVEYYLMCGAPGASSAPVTVPIPAIAEFAQRLLTEHPREAGRAYQPLVGLLVELLVEAAGAAAIRPDLDHRRLAGVLLQMISTNAFATTISGLPRAEPMVAAEDLWQLIRQGVATDR
jgi:AcrR family transcriptional regulator